MYIGRVFKQMKLAAESEGEDELAWFVHDFSLVPPGTQRIVVVYDSEDPTSSETTWL